MNVDISSKAAAGRSKNLEPVVTDTSIAQGIVQNAFPIRTGRNVKAAIGDAFEALRRRERAIPVDALRDRPRQWTERRVKALWHREAKRIDHYEIEDLTAVAVEEARIERQRLRAREARLEAFIVRATARETGEVAEPLGGRAGGLGMSRASGGTDADENYHQSAEYREE